MAVRWLLTFTILATSAATAAAQAPADVVMRAAADAARLPAGVALRTRYLSLHNLPEEDRAWCVRVLGGHLNLLSREPDIVRPGQVGLLLRINLDDYGEAFARAWEQLAEAEPYFHATVEVEKVEKVTKRQAYGYKQPDGSWKVTEYRDEVVEEKRKVRLPAQAPWLADTPEHQQALLSLLALTGSQVPVVSAEWFVFQTAIQADRKPGYYDFLGVKDERTFQQAVGFVAKGIDPGFLRELRESVAVSSVTLQPRALERLPTVGGAYWRTRDVRQAKDRSNPLRVLNDDLVFDATEQFGHLPNGLWATGLFNAKGERQDTAPDFIASDSTAPHNDRRVHVNLSCLRCHADGGLQDVSGWVRSVLNSPPNFLASPDPGELRRLRQQYLRRLEPFLEADRKRYAEALAEATGGLKPAEYAAGLARLWKEYAEDPVTLERAACDLGTTPERFLEALQLQGPAVDPVLGAFRAVPPGAIPVTAWREAYPLAQAALLGTKGK